MLHSDPSLVAYFDNILKETRPERLTSGRDRLKILLAEPGHNQPWLAKALGMATPSVWAWVEGVTRPAPHHRIALQRLFGIPADSWMTAAERTVAVGTIA